MPVFIPSSKEAKGSESVPIASRKIWTAGTLTYTSRGLVALFAWLLFGDFAWSMRDRSVGPMAGWYLNSIGVSNLLYGVLLTSFPALIGIFLGPIISVKSDRHRSKRGRRIPFLLVITPLAAFGMIGLAVTPLVAKWVHGHFPSQGETLLAVICFSVFWALFEVASIAGGAVFSGLINDVVPKPLFGRFYGLFRAVTLIDGILFNYWLMGKMPDHFTFMLVCIGVLYGTAFLWMCIKVREGEYPPPSPSLATGRSLHRRGTEEVKIYFRDCYRNPYYRSIYLFLVFGYLANAPINTFALPYANSLHLSMDGYGKGLALTYLISLGISYFIGWLVDIFHPLRMVIIVLIFYTLVMLAGGVFATTQSAFFIFWVAHGALSGCFFTSAISLGQRLFPHQKFAQYSSAFGVVNSIATVALIPFIGLLIDGTGATYRYTFFIGGIVAAFAVILGLIVYRQFMRFGGPRNYRAPE